MYKTCGTACPAVCGQSTPFFCTLQCVIGCQCPSGMHLDPDVNKCVTECPTSTTLPPTTITTETRPIPEDAAGQPIFEAKKCMHFVFFESLLHSVKFLGPTLKNMFI